MSPPDAHRPSGGTESRADDQAASEIDSHHSGNGIAGIDPSTYIAETLRIALEAEEAHDEVDRLVKGAGLYELREERDYKVATAVEAWKLAGEPEEHADAIRALPRFEHWYTWDPETTAAFEALEPEPHPRIRKGGTFALDVPDQPPAVWGDGSRVAWASGEGLMIPAPPGVGKTTLAMQLVAGRIGAVDQVLGMPVQSDDRPVLYLAMDRPTQIQRATHRLFAHLGTARDVLDERLVFWAGPLSATLNAHPEVIVELAVSLEVGTVVVDSLKDAAVKLTDDEAGGNINRAFQEVVAEGIELLVLHHQRKGPADRSKAPKTLDEVYGSALITAGMGSVVSLHGAAGDPIVELTHLKQPLDELGPWRVEHDNQSGLSLVLDGFDPLRFLRNRKTTGATAREAAEAMFAKSNPTANQVAKAKRQLERLVREMPDRVTRSSPARGGDGGQEAVLYTYTEPGIELLGAATDPATRGVAA